VKGTPPRRRAGSRGADRPSPAPLRALVAVNDAALEKRLAMCAELRVLAVVRDLAALERHVRCGGAAALVLDRRFTVDADAALELLPAAWGALILCGPVGPAALRLALRVSGRAGTRTLYGARVPSAALRRALLGLAADATAVTEG